MLMCGMLERHTEQLTLELNITVNSPRGILFHSITRILGTNQYAAFMSHV